MKEKSEKDAASSLLTVEEGTVQHTILAPTHQMGCLRKNAFLLVTFLGIVVGFGVGLAVRKLEPSKDAIMWLGMPGELYMRMLKSLILPLIISSVILGTASTDPKSNGRISLLTFGYIISTNGLGALLGVATFFIASPGPDPGASMTNRGPDTRNLRTMDIFADFLRNLVPDNIVGATLQQSQTRYTAISNITQVNLSGQLVNVTSVEMVRGQGVTGSTNLLGLIVVCSGLGIAAAYVGEIAKPFLQFLKSVNVIVLRLFDWLKWTTPIGVTSLIAKNLALVSDLESALNIMGIFVAATCGVNLLYQFVFMPGLHFIITRGNPFKFLASLMKPWPLAFASTSQTIALPELMEVSEQDMKIDRRIGGFVLPIAVTLNRDSSTCFITITCLFIAAYSGAVMEAGLIVTMTFISFLSSFAIPAVPSSSIVTILVIISSFGIPPTNIGLILAVEFLTDRIRTTGSLSSTLNAPTIVWHWCKHLLHEEDLKHANIINAEIELDLDQNNRKQEGIISS